MQLTRAQLDAMLAALIATGGPFDPAATAVGVAAAVAGAGVDTVLADVTQGTGALATRQLVTAWGTPYVLNDGSAVVDGPLMEFAPANAGEAQTIAAWYLATALTAGALISFQMLPLPVYLPDATSHWNFILRLTVSPSGQWDVSISFNG